MSIDWEKVAKSNGLSTDEFTKELFLSACSIGMMLIDDRKEENMLKFKCEDSVGEIILTVRRA